MLMSGNRLNRIMTTQCFSQRYQRIILFLPERLVIRSFDFHTDRKIIASRPAAIIGNPCMPGPLVCRYELDQRSVTPDQKMG